MNWVPFAIAALLIVPVAYLVYRYRPRQSSVSKEILLANTFGKVLEGERETVLDEMRQLYQQTGQDVGVGLALGILLRFLGKNQIAIRTHRSLLTHPSLSKELKAMVYTELSADYLACGLLERAEKALDEAREIQPPDEHMTRYGERIYTRLKKWDEAFKLIKAYGKRQKLDVTQRLGLLCYLQGETLWNAGQEEEAHAAYKKAVTVDVACAPAYLALARYHRLRGKPAKALALLAKRSDSFQGKEWLCMEAYRDIAVQTEDHDLFQEKIDARLEEEPNDWRSRMVLGGFMTDIGEYRQAGAELMRCLKQAQHIYSSGGDI